MPYKPYSTPVPTLLLVCVLFSLYDKLEIWYHSGEKEVEAENLDTDFIMFGNLLINGGLTNQIATN